MARRNHTRSPHTYKVLTFDDDVAANDKHCQLSIINEKGDSKYYRSNKSYKDNERKYPDQKTTMVKRTDAENKNLVTRDQYLFGDDSKSDPYYPHNHEKQGYAESCHTKHRKYCSSDSSKSENTVSNYRNSCLSYTSTVSSDFSNNRKLKQSNKQISEYGKQIDLTSHDHRRYQTHFKASYEGSEKSSLYSSSSKYTTENEIENSHHHHLSRMRSTAGHRPHPKISTMTACAFSSTFLNPHTSRKSRSQEPQQREYNSQSERNKTAEKESSKCAVNMCISGHDQQNNLRPYTDRHHKETTNKNSLYCNTREANNVVVAEPLLDYTKTEFNNRNTVEKGKKKISSGVTDENGLARKQKKDENNVGTDPLPRKNNQSWLLEIFCRKRRKRRRRNIPISFKKRRRRRRRLRKRSRNHVTPSSNPAPDNYTKDRNHKLEVNTSKNNNESNKLVDFEDSKTDQSIDSSSLIEGLKSVLSKVCKYQSRDTNRNLEHDREEKYCYKDNNHETARNKMSVKIPFQQSKDNLKYHVGGEIDMDEKRSPEVRCPTPMSKVIVNTAVQRIPTHKIPYTQSDDSCYSQIEEKDEIKIRDYHQTPVQDNAIEKEVLAKDIDCVESGKVNIEYGDTCTLPDQIKTDVNKASPSNLLRSLCKHSFACIIAVLWSPCLLAVGLCCLITYPVRPTKPAGQRRNNIFSRAFNIWLRRNMNPCCFLSNMLRRRNLNSRQKHNINYNCDVRRISTAKQQIPNKIKRNYLIYPCSVRNTRNSKPSELNKHGLKLVTFPSEPEYSECNMRPLIKREVVTKLSMKQSREPDSSEGKRRNKRTEVKKTVHKEICASSLSKKEQASKGEMKKEPKISVGCMCSSSTKADTFASNTVHTNPSDKDKKVTFSWHKAKIDIPTCCNKDHSDCNKLPKDLGIRERVPKDRSSRDVPKDYFSCGNVREDPGSRNVGQKFACTCDKAPKDHCDCNKLSKDPGFKIPKDRTSRGMMQNITFLGHKLPKDPGTHDKVMKDVGFREKVPKDTGFRDRSKIVIHQRDNLADMVQKSICSYDKALKDLNPRDKVLEDGSRGKVSKNSGPHDRVPRDRDSRDIVTQGINSCYDKLPKYPDSCHKVPVNTGLCDKLPKNPSLRDKVPKDRGMHFKVPKDCGSRDKAKIVIYLHDRVPKDKVYKDRSFRDTVVEDVRLNDSKLIDPSSHFKISREQNPRSEVSEDRVARDIVPKDINCQYETLSKSPGPRDKALEYPGLDDRAPKDRDTFNKKFKYPRRDIEQKIINSHEKVLKDPGLRYKMPRGRDLCDMKQRVSFSRDKVSEHHSSRDKLHGDQKFICSCGKEPKDHCSCNKVLKDRHSRDIVLKIIRSSRDILPTKDQKLHCSCDKAPKDHCECHKLPQKPVSADRVPKNHVSRDKVLKDHKFTCSYGKGPQDFCECGKVPENPDTRDEVPKDCSSRDIGPKFSFSGEKVYKDPGSRKEVLNDQKFTCSCDMVTKYCYCSSYKNVEDSGLRDLEQKFICACDKVSKDHCECDKVPKDLVSHDKVLKERFSRDMEQKSICACHKVPKDHCECDKVPKDLVSHDKVPKDRSSRDMVRKVTFSGEKALCPRHKVPKDRESRDMMQKLSCSNGKVSKHDCSHDKHKHGVFNIPEKKPIRNINARKTCNKSNKIKRTKSIPDLRKRKTKSITNFVACRFRKWKGELNPLIDCNLASYQNCQKYLGKPPTRPFVRSSPNVRETLGHCLNIMTCCIAGSFCLPWIFCCQICCRLLCCCE